MEDLCLLHNGKKKIDLHKFGFTLPMHHYSDMANKSYTDGTVLYFEIHTCIFPILRQSSLLERNTILMGILYLHANLISFFLFVVRIQITKDTSDKQSLLITGTFFAAAQRRRC